MYNSNLNLNLYKVFYDVAQYGSVSTASKNLNVSQPAISRSIKKLEEDLNVTLFYRTLNGMVLTEKGKELLSYVEEACNNLRIGERTMMETNNLIKGKLSIGIPYHIASFYLFDKIKRFHDEYPNIEILVVSGGTLDLIKKLEKHEIDFVIDTTPIYGNEKEINIVELFDMQYIFFKLKGDETSASKLKDLENKQLLLPVAKSSNFKKLNEIAESINVKFKNIIAIETSEMIKDAVMQGNGIGYILEDIIKKDIEDGRFEKLDIEEELPKVSVALVYIDKYLMNAPKKFIKDYLNQEIN